MSDKLTYKKIFIDSKYRSTQSNSSADFSVELNENLETPGDKIICNRHIYSSGVEIYRGGLLRIYLCYGF